MSLGYLDKLIPEQQQAKNGKVRKYRRSHKNSRDGCPNCRSKRVKCTEELPACSNCVRKHLRCGYLDFSADRLVHIQKKNEAKKRSLVNDLLSYENSKPTDYMLTNPSLLLTMREFDQESTSPKLKLEFDNVDMSRENPPPINPSFRSENSASKIRKSVSVKKRSESNSGLQRTLSVKDFPSVTYSEISNQAIGKDNEYDWWSIPGSYYSDSLFLSEFDSAMDGQNENRSVFTLSGELPPVLSVQEDMPKDPNHKMLQTTPTHNSQFMTPYTESISNSIDSLSLSHASSEEKETWIKIASGKPLPNAYHKLTVFRRKKIPLKLRNVILEETMARFKTENFCLKNFTNEHLLEFAKPVWSEADAAKFWTSVIQQLSVLNVYFHYFINKAVNILVRASLAVINGDIDIGSPPQTNLTNISISLPLPPETVYPSTFFYTQADLSMLAQKSYTTFDVLIRSLRESISKYHEEYPAKMSLVSAWGCYFHQVPNVRTFCFMMSGTHSLLQNSLNKNTHISNLSIALRRGIQLLKNFYNAGMYPDYDFAMAESLIKNFQKYKNFVQYLIDSYEAGQNFEPDLVQVLKDPLFRHDYHETDKFLNRLQNHFYPIFRETDAYYKSKCTKQLDSNTRFVSPTLTFDLAFEWFQVYRGDKTCLSRRVNPLKKTFYVFLNALGKALAHIFPSLKYLSVVDPCNVAFSKVGFTAPEFDPWNRPRYHSIAPIFMDLVKTIKFFENRLKLCGYMAFPINSDKYITKVPLSAPETWEYRDIVHMSAEKLPLKETQLKSMSDTVIQKANYAFFDEILQEPSCAELIKAEEERQRNALYNDPREFCEKTGMLNHDFDASAIVDRYSQLCVEKMTTQETLIKELQEINESMSECRQEISNAVNNNE